MKIRQTPDPEVMIEVSPEEFLELREKGGLILQTETKSDESAFFWRVNGTWILVLVKDMIDVSTREASRT